VDYEVATANRLLGSCLPQFELVENKSVPRPAQLTDHRIRTEVEEALHKETAAAVVSSPPSVALTIADHPPSNGKLTLTKGRRTTVHPAGKAKLITLTH
jgi:hypothetical protein